MMIGERRFIVYRYLPKENNNRFEALKRTRIDIGIARIVEANGSRIRFIFSLIAKGERNISGSFGREGN